MCRHDPDVNDRVATLLKRWIPVGVLGDLTIALATFVFDWSPVPVYLLLALTVVATIIATVLFLITKRGMSTAQNLGFKRSRDAFAYQMLYRGISPPSFLLTFGSFAVCIYCSGGNSASGVLALATLPLIGLNQALTRKYPAGKY